MLQGAENNKKPTCHPEVRRKSHPDLIASVTGSMTICQAGKTPLLPSPAQGRSSIAPCHPFASRTVAQVSALDCPWSLFSSTRHSRAMALTYWRAAMQTCTFSVGLTPFHSAPSSSPAHQLHSSHYEFPTLELCLSFISLPMPHLAFCPPCLGGSRFCSHRSCPLLQDPLHLEVQHRMTPTFQ